MTTYKGAMKIGLLLLALVLCVPVQIAFTDDFEDGVAAYDKGDQQTAHGLLLKAAEQGNAAAQNNLGLMYAKVRAWRRIMQMRTSGST